MKTVVVAHSIHGQCRSGHRRSVAAGAAITEAVLVLPVLLLLLMITYQVFRTYMVACNANTVVRTEMMIHCYRHCMESDGDIWSSTPKNKYNKDEKVFKAMGVFPEDATLDILPYSDFKKTATWRRFIEMLSSIAAGTDTISVNVELPTLPYIGALMADSTVQTPASTTYYCKGTCAVDTINYIKPLAYAERFLNAGVQFFKGWNHDVPDVVDAEEDEPYVYEPEE